KVDAMTITMRAGWRLVFLCLCCLGMPLKVVILDPSVINAAENRAGIITISCNGTSPQQRRTQGQAEIDQAASLNRQGQQYQEQGRYKEAEPLYRRALVIYERVLGPNHPDTATILDNLAALYQMQGRYGAAEPLVKRSLAIREKVLGPDHPSTALNLNN